MFLLTYSVSATCFSIKSPATRISTQERIYAETVNLFRLASLSISLYSASLSLTLTGLDATY